MKKHEIAVEVSKQGVERYKRLDIDADALLKRAGTITTTDPRELTGHPSAHVATAMGSIMTSSRIPAENGMLQRRGTQESHTRLRSRVWLKHHLPPAPRLP